ncbi:modifier of mdg4 isoform X7 [Teleopsis dalmanni]|uniref:modifier of mdg4 isoform X7 n=1 Tax=Teleopsis dalmanni TaxID=139649 RepID=UPI0018CCED70|nr:modifier of mdg4 isoform X7 [Teleopsis dalmanni]
MADDEQFSLCWNNFNSNLSAGFHESLCRGDLVDVTLAAEGQLVKAHRLVLSVCSPYFRKMFTQMPANQHAFVFLKDVSHTALKDLIQFMYCGEVNVKQEALPAFISTAEALQIKGLTDSDPAPSSSPAEPSTPTPQIQQITSPRVRQQRTSQTRSYKIETIDDSDEKPATQIVIQTTAAPQATIAQQQASHLQQHTHHHSSAQQISSVPATATVVTHKRPAQRSIGSAPHIKRTKSTIDPLDASESATSQITVQATVVDSKAQQSDTEYIDMPMEIPTKSEPDYSEDAGEVNATDHEATYVEDDSYGDMRYDESYFTENEDGTANASVATSVTGGNSGGVNVSNASVATTSTKALIKQQTSFSDSSYVDAADQSNNDAQDTIRSFAFALTNYKTEISNVDESFLPKISDKVRVKTGISTREPHFLDSRGIDDWGNMRYDTTARGNKVLHFEGHRFTKNNVYGSNIYWKCTKWHSACKARAITSLNEPWRCILKGTHNHAIGNED